MFTSSLSEVVNPKLVTGICSLVVVVMDDDVVGAMVSGTKHGVCVQWRGKKKTFKDSVSVRAV